MSFPNAEVRRHCWDKRDAYWQCIDDNDGENSKCLSQREQFQAHCSKQWVKYFDRRRDYEKYKAKLEKGYNPLAEEKVM